MSGPPRLGSVERFAARAMSIVNDALATTAKKNELALARARIVVCALFAVRQVVLYGDSLRALNPKDTLIFVALLIAIALSAVYLSQRAAVLAVPLMRWQLTFTVLDVSLFVCSTFPIVMWPEADYTGILMTPFAGVGTLVNTSAGMRMRRGYALGTSGAVMVAFLVLCFFDVARWGDRVVWDAGELVFYTLEIGAAGIVAVIVARRTLDLAVNSAERAIEAERARERLGSYVGREVAEQALRGDEIVMGGVRQPVAVLFSDLRGFTTYSEKIPPEEMVTQLNAYLEDMVAGRCPGRC